MVSSIKHPKKEKNKKIVCPTCGVETNHQLVWTGKEDNWKNDDGDMWGSTIFEVFQCLGCETPTLMKTVIFSEDLDIIEKDGKEEAFYVPTITLWPKRSVDMKKIKSFYDAPPKINRVYRETVDAYNNDLPTLCAIGIRTVIEAVCSAEGIAGTNLKEKIEKLKTKRVITEKLHSGLQTSRLLGNISAHESPSFDNTELIAGLELIESMLDAHYNSDARELLLKNKLNKSDQQTQED